MIHHRSSSMSKIKWVHLSSLFSFFLFFLSFLVWRNHPFRIWRKLRKNSTISIVTLLVRENYSTSISLYAISRCNESQWCGMVSRTYREQHFSTVKPRTDAHCSRRREQGDEIVLEEHIYLFRDILSRMNDKFSTNCYVTIQNGSKWDRESFLFSSISLYNNIR